MSEKKLNQNSKSASYEVAFCEKCGSKVNAGDDFCANCGSKVEKDYVVADNTATKAEQNVAVPNDAVSKNINQKVKKPKVKKQKIKKQKTKKPFSKKKLIVICSSAAVIIAAFVICFIFLISPMMKYNGAKELLKNGDYDKAKSEFTELGDYQDSKDMINECDYQNAINLREKGSYEESRSRFQEMGDYKDSKDQIYLCNRMMLKDYIETNGSSVDDGYLISDYYDIKSSYSWETVSGAPSTKLMWDDGYKILIYAKDDGVEIRYMQDGSAFATGSAIRSGLGQSTEGFTILLKDDFNNDTVGGIFQWQVGSNPIVQDVGKASFDSKKANADTVITFDSFERKNIDASTGNETTVSNSLDYDDDVSEYSNLAYGRIMNKLDDVLEGSGFTMNDLGIDVN